MRRQARAILSVAGSDPSGGAGIQADIKTLTVLGVYGAAAVTAVTVQNSLGMESCQPLAPELVAAQVRAVLADLKVSHVKIGMIGSWAVAQAFVQELADFAGEVFYDPVISSSVGRPLSATDGLEGVWRVAGLATVMTPNLPELSLLAGRELINAEQALLAGAELFARLPKLKAVVLKGGHLDEGRPEVSDFLLLPGLPPLSRRHPRVITPNTHGTGCTFAAALAAYHQRGGDYRRAFEQTVDFLAHLLQLGAGWRLGQGNGGLCHHLLCSPKDDG